MAAPLYYVDGFDHQDLTRYGTYGGTPTFPAGRFGDYAIQMPTAAAFIDIPLPSGTTALSFGFAMKTTARSTTTTQLPFLYLLSPTGVVVHFLQIARLDTAGQVGYFQNGTGSYTSSFGVLQPSDTWQTWEHRLVYGTSGSHETRVNGANVYSRTGNTNHSSHASVGFLRLMASGTTNQYVFDDLWIEVGSGAGFRGDRRVTLIKPTADSSVQWDTSTGANHYSQVADASTATFVTTPALTSEVDAFDFADLPASVAGIEGVMVTAVARKSDVGSAKVAVHRGGTAGTAKDISASATWQNVFQAFETAGDATTWTPAKVNASTFGIVSAT